MRFKKNTRTNWKDNAPTGERISLPNDTLGRAVACGDLIAPLNDKRGRAVALRHSAVP